MHPEERTAIVMRLRSAEGHLGAVIGLLEAGEAPCEQVLHQLGAVRAALRVAGARLLDNQINYSEEIIQNGTCPEDRAAELNRLVNLYYLVVQYSDQVEMMRNE
jgi:DNA-binding FrmR family transcriptional regulator